MRRSGSSALLCAGLFAAALMGCNDGGECAGEPPLGCAEADTTRNCCRTVAAVCQSDGTWFCPRPEDMMFACEGTCDSPEQCLNEPVCFEDVGGGCCGDRVDAVCVTPNAFCPEGSLAADACSDCAGPTPGDAGS